MERFRKFIDRDLNIENVKNEDLLGGHGVVCTYLPEPVGEFDELEFRTGFQAVNDLVITVAVEMGKVKRVMFSAAREEDPDDTRSLTGPEMERLLTEKGDHLARFLQLITLG